ncbi:MAG: AAA family ATPase [Actinobacteria bacterium]|nr:AAA family ATPase [Actinomycetota bacterium]
MNKNAYELKVIIADKDLETFNITGALSPEFSLINLSSSFAVEFILEYEKIDVLIINQGIGGLSDVLKRADKKKVRVFIIGKDLKLPLDINEIRRALLSEKESRQKNNNARSIIKSLKGLFGSKKPFHRYTRDFGTSLKERNFLLNPDDAAAVPGEKDLHGSCNQGLDGKPCEHKLAINSNYQSGPGHTTVNYHEENGKGQCVEKDCQAKPVQANFLQGSGVPNLFSGPAFKGRDKDMEIRTIKQKVIILARAKGGVGSTILSIYIGKILDRSGINTLLVDLNFSEGGGDLGYYLNIPKTPNIINFTDGYSKESLKNSIIKISKNLDIIQSPPTYELSKNIDLQDIYCLTDLAKKKYHLIIFDLSDRLDDLWLGVIDLADLLVMVSDQTYGSVGRLLEIDARYLYGELDKFLIINRFQDSNSWDLIQPQIKNFLHLKDFVILREETSLKGVIEFSGLAFPALDHFNILDQKILNLLT